MPPILFIVLVVVGVAILGGIIGLTIAHVYFQRRTIKRSEKRKERYRRLDVEDILELFRNDLK